jgi:Tol biopolymer transport system component
MGYVSLSNRFYICGASLAAAFALSGCGPAISETQPIPQSTIPLGSPSFTAPPGETGTPVLPSAAPTKAPYTIRLTRGKESCDSPAWSPDGMEIVFLKDGLLWKRNRDGFAPKSLNVPMAAVRPVYSPDGDRIAFAARDRAALYVAGPEGRELLKIGSPLNTQGRPLYEWSPDGGHLAWVSVINGQSGLWVWDAADRVNRSLYTAPAPWSWLRWADSEFLVVYEDGGGDITPIRIGVEGGSRRQPSFRLPADARFAEISPDGAMVAYILPRENSIEGQLWLMSTADSQGRKLSPESASYPAWSPDGRRIVFGGPPDRKRPIQVMGADGSGLRTLVAENLFIPEGYAWSPDGETLAYASGRGVTNRNPGVLIFDIVIVVSAG